jgi:hypothetical protein
MLSLCLHIFFRGTIQKVARAVILRKAAPVLDLRRAVMPYVIANVIE